MAEQGWAALVYALAAIGAIVVSVAIGALVADAVADRRGRR